MSIRIGLLFRKLAVILTAALFACTAACPMGSGKKSGPAGSKGKGNEVAVFNLSGELAEVQTMSDILGPSRPVLHRLLKKMRKAAEDPNIGTVAIRIGSLTAGWGQLAELRQAVARVRKAGKTVFAYLDNPTNGTYYLASAAGKVYLSPGSSMWTVGLAAQVTFIKGLLGKLGIEADMVWMGKYKGAAEPLTRKNLSPALREALNAMLDSLNNEFVQAIVKGRRLDAAAVKKALDGAPLTGRQAVQLKLVDGIKAYRTHVKELAGKAKIHWKYAKKKKKKGSFDALLELLRPGQGKPPPKKPHVALVYAVGPIVYGSGSDGLFDDDKVVASRKMEKILNKLARNKRVKAVVLRIDSPGGSALASDVIWLALRRLTRKKPVVVSMGDVAASGGYYIAAAGDRIFAQPSTLTGSIGVVGGKFSLAGTFKKIGITQETLKRAAHADLFTAGRKFTDEERKQVRALMAETYDQFLDRVSKGRRMARAQVKAVAEGRVWTGQAAVRHKLVDRIGGLYDAVAAARKLGKLPDDASVAIYPRPKGFLGMLQEKLNPRGDASLSPSSLTFGLKVLGLFDPRLSRRLAQLARAALMFRREPVLTMFPAAVEVR